MVEWKQIVRGDFFEIKLLLQPDVDFDYESNENVQKTLTLTSDDIL